MPRRNGARLARSRQAGSRSAPRPPPLSIFRRHRPAPRRLGGTPRRRDSRACAAQCRRAPGPCSPSRPRPGCLLGIPSCNWASRRWPARPAALLCACRHRRRRPLRCRRRRTLRCFDASTRPDPGSHEGGRIPAPESTNSHSCLRPRPLPEFSAFVLSPSLAICVLSHASGKLGSIYLAQLVSAGFASIMMGTAQSGPKRT